MIDLTVLAYFSWFDKLTLVMIGLVFLLIVFGAIEKLGKKKKNKNRKEQP